MQKTRNAGKRYKTQLRIDFIISTISICGAHESQISDVFDIFEIRDLFIKIIQKGGSLKDILYVEQRIIAAIKETKDIELIARIVCKDLKNRESLN